MYTWNRKRKEEVYMIGETCPPSIPPSSYKQAPVEEIFEKGGGCNSEIAHRSCIPFFGKRVIFSFYYTIRQFLGVNSSQDLDNAKFVHRQTHKVLCTKSMYVCINVLGMF